MARLGVSTKRRHSGVGGESELAADLRKYAAVAPSALLEVEETLQEELGDHEVLVARKGRSFDSLGGAGGLPRRSITKESKSRSV